MNPKPESPGRREPSRSKKSYSLKTTPEASRPCLFSGLLALDCDSILCSTWRVKSTSAARSEIDAQEKFISFFKVGVLTRVMSGRDSASLDTGASAKAANINVDDLSEVIRGLDKKAQGEFSLRLLLAARTPDQLRDTVPAVHRIFVDARAQVMEPFGMIFAYNLDGNSLASLVENLRAWEASTPATLWPNYVCVLGVGVISHFSSASMKDCIDSSEIVFEAWPKSVSYGKDSLFQFYSALHDVGARMQLGPVELRHYYDPAVQIGKYVVYGKGFEGILTKDGTASGKSVRLKESTIDRVIEWCAIRGPMRYEDVFLKQFGMIPQGMENLVDLNLEVYVYNPDSLPGLHEIGKYPITMVNGRPSIPPSLATAFTLDINGQRYVIAGHGFTEDDWEDAQIPGVA